MDSIVRTLTSLPERSGSAPPEDGMRSRTARLRDLLADGPLTAAQLSHRSGMTSSSVSAFLANDVKKGRVVLERGAFRISGDFSQAKEKQLRDAIALLRANGYAVIKAPK